MALGAPVVARDTVYNREVLGEGAGELVEPNPRSIIEAIEVVLSDRARQVKMSSSARERFASTYTWDSVCAAYENSLIAALESRRS